MHTEDNKKVRIAELERQKISLEDQLQFTTDVKRIIEIEEELFEVKDTIKKLTEPWGVTDVQSTH
jgi:Asp-tRNA(Asn)/Glu-tRNA(Gln) amidotransferase C subunit|tara:strand:+ start:211 stop:405 length:195 start_codon:yes stop_codon:yes gene_type:complete